MKCIKILVFLSLCLHVFSVQAVRVDNLYGAAVPVPNESEAVQKSALRSAMAIVLVKLTGDRQSVNKSEFTNMLNEAEKYTRQFGYKKITDATGAQNLQLVVQFEENLINSAFRERGLVAWGRERPSVLLWLAEVGFGNDRLLGLDNGQVPLNILNQRSQRRGLGVVFPLLDLQDSSQISPADLVASNSSIITEASSRYPADAVLAGTIELSESGTWTSKWTALINGVVSTFNTSGETRDAALQEGMDVMVDKVAGAYARTTYSSDAVSDSSQIVVSNINSADDYARALQYLRGLNTVTAVNVTQLESDKVYFSIESLGGMATIYQSINLGNTLQSSGSGSSSFSLSAY